MKDRNKKEFDRFIQIAVGGKGINGEIKRLEEIPPKIYDCKEIPITENRDIVYPEFNEEIAYENFLKEKEFLKAKYRPFFKKYSSTPITPVQKIELKNFLFRRETEEDKKDFSLVLNKKGEFNNITLPHYDGPEGRWNAFYLTTITIDELNDDTHYVLDFEAVDYVCEVYLNGRLVGSHTGFFAPFKIDITENVLNGENTLLIVAKNDYTTNGVFTKDGFRNFGDKIYAATSFGYDEPILGWHHCPAGAGIVGTIELVKCKRQRVTDVFIRPDIDNGKFTAYTTVFNYSTSVDQLKVFYTLEGKNFKETIFEKVEGKIDKLSVNCNYLVKEFSLENFKLWTLDEPYLYDFKVTLTDLDGNVVDEYQTHFGMRKFHMDETSTPKGAFYFNNERIMLRGTNEMGHLPRAVMENNDEHLLDDIITAKVCNLNFYRVTQRPVFKKIYDYFDMCGMLCQTDFPLFSYIKASAVGEALKQVVEMEILTRNHP